VGEKLGSAMLKLPALDTKIPVLLLKRDPCVIHHGAVGIARSFGKLGVPVYAIVEDRYTPLATCRYVAGAFVDRSRDTKEFLQHVAAIGESLKRPAIVLPTDDSGAIFISEHADILRRWFLFPNLPTGLPRQLADKASLYSLCREIGISCPEHAVPKSIAQVHEFIGRATFPVVIKAGEHSRRLNNRHSSFIVQNPDELLAFCGPAGRFLRPDLIFQEYIPGEDWIFHGYRNPETDCFVGFTGRKLRSYPASAGPTTLGVSIANETLSRQTEVMLSALRYSGVLDIDYRRDERDGRYKLVDFNPRVGANFRMFEDHAGVDVVRALHLDLTDRDIGKSPMIEGRIFIVELHDCFAALAYLGKGELTVRKWWCSFSGMRELAWWSWSDPLPFLVMGVRLLLRAVVRGARARWEQAKTLLHFWQKSRKPYRAVEHK
jgi:D-aspartate ligase